MQYKKMAYKRPSYISVPVRIDTLNSYRKFFLAEKMACRIFPVLIEEAIANPEYEKAIRGIFEADRDVSRGRGFLQLKDREKYDTFLGVFESTAANPVDWNTALIKAFLENQWIRRTVGDRLFRL